MTVYRTFNKIYIGTGTYNLTCVKRLSSLGTMGIKMMLVLQFTVTFALLERLSTSMAVGICRFNSLNNFAIDLLSHAFVAGCTNQPSAIFQNLVESISRGLEVIITAIIKAIHL